MSDAGTQLLVLVSDAFGGFGGISQYNRDLITALCSLDETGRIVALPRIVKAPPGPLPAKLDFDTSGVGGKLRYGLSVLRRGLGGPRPDIVFCGHMNLLPLAATIARMRRAKLVLQLHGIDAWTPNDRQIANTLTAQVDVVLSVSQVTVDRYLGWARPPRIGTHVIPNTIDLAGYSPGPKAPDLEAQFGLAGRKVLMTVGRLAGAERYKGFDRTIEALPAIVEADPSIVYVIAGTGDDLERLRAKAAQFGMADHVVFTGFVPEDRKADYFRLADVYLMPSMGEGFGIVCLEAMACGIPTVASTEDGTREALRNGMLGRLVHPRRPEEIKAAVFASLGAPRIVPDGLEYFALPEFRARVHDFFYGAASPFLKH